MLYPKIQKNSSVLAKGFTLIEILIVVVIIALLATAIVPQLMDRPAQARIAKAKQDIQQIESALNMYRLDNFRYPSAEQGLQALVQKPGGAASWKQGGYISRLTKDPWGNDYIYIFPGQNGDVDILTLGADATQGGEGENADIGNWNLGQ